MTRFRDYEMVRVASAARAGVVRGLPRRPYPRQAPHHSQILYRTVPPCHQRRLTTATGRAAWPLPSAPPAVLYSPGVTGFDRHRRCGRCLDPATIGLVLKEQRRRNGELLWVGWGKPGSWIPDDDTDGDP